MPGGTRRLSGPTAAVSGDNILYTCPDNHTVVVTRLNVVNSTSSTKVNVKMGLNASTDANLVTPLITVPGRQMVDKDTHVVMHAPDGAGADTLVLNASATGVTVTVSGFIEQPR